jgi:hypothetical protein
VTIKGEKTMTAVNWWSSRQGPTSGYEAWANSEHLELAPGSAVWVRVAAVNGASETVDGHVNFVVPRVVEVAKYDQETRAYSPPREGAENTTAGSPPAHEVKFFSVERRWLAGQVWMGIYLVAIPAFVTGTVPLLYEVGDAETVRYCDIS